MTLMYSSSGDGSEWVRDGLACVTSQAFERYSSTYRVSDLHSAPMMSPMDSFPRERSITSGTCHGISWFCITISLQYSQSDRNWNAFFKGFPGGLDGKASACNVGGPGSIPGLERSPREGNNNPLQYSCLGNPMDGEAW